MADRNALLSQIKGGKKLKSTKTVDKSKPVAGKILDSPTASTVPKSSLSSDSGSASSKPNPPAVPGGFGNLFSGGIPKLKSRQGGVSTGRGSSSENQIENPSNNNFKTSEVNSSSLYNKDIQFGNPSNRNGISANAPKNSFSPNNFENNTKSSIGFNQNNFRNEPLSHATSFASLKSPSPASVLKKKPPPPPPSKSKPSIAGPSSPNHFATLPKNFSNPSNLRQSQNGSFGSSNHVRTLSSQFSESLNLNKSSTPPPPNSLPKLPALPSTQDSSLFESKWKFHAIEMLPKISPNDKSTIGKHVYPNGKTSGTSNFIKAPLSMLRVANFISF
ncbi:hypothetical protein AYI69_g6887 [Smittium culicis]|uniref:WH2 domain-containing protein n=1 Tax=Smittium culicis TaxID=133412 RepID=A0A1R1XVR3_9FUNG|nr:hypothetical protein AYI69_g6887 [Smittium culicis]